MKNKFLMFLGVLGVSVGFWVFLIALAIPNAEKTVKEKDVVFDVTVDFEENVVFESKTTKQETTCTTTKKEHMGEFVLTAYCSCEKCCGKWALNRPKDKKGNDIVYGASGEVLKSGVSIAVDPNVIPYGSRVYIEGKEYIAQDCGGAIKGNRIDVYFSDHNSALRFGKKTAEVQVDYINGGGK